MRSRYAPDISLAPIPKGYGELLVHGFDWWQECLDLIIPAHLWNSLKEQKARAIELDDRRKTPIDFNFGDHPFQLMPNGATGGKEFILENEDFRVEIGALNRKWSVSWRARSAAIWHYGIDELRKAIYDIFQTAGFMPNPEYPDDYIRLTRVDYCFDVHSPRFTNQMYPRLAKQVVCPKETKSRGDFIIQKDRVETLTIGMGSPCQVQIYNKSREITEASGKTWLYDFWETDWQTGEVRDNIPDEWEDVWRTEIRLRSKWLKFRKANTPDSFLKHRWQLIADGLSNRRLCQPTKDSNRSRWPFHTLYSMILMEIGNPREFRPIDKRVTGRADVLEKTIMQGIAGSVRSLVMLRLRELGEFTEEEAEKVIKEALEMLLRDTLHEEKVRRAVEKYELVDAAK